MTGVHWRWRHRGSRRSTFPREDSTQKPITPFRSLQWTPGRISWVWPYLVKVLQVYVRCHLRGGALTLLRGVGRFRTFHFPQSFSVTPGTDHPSVPFGFRDPRSFARGIRNPGKFCLWNPESWAMEFGISLTIGVRNPTSTIRDLNSVPESGNLGLESGIQDILGFPYNWVKYAHNKGNNSRHFNCWLQFPLEN